MSLWHANVHTCTCIPGNRYVFENKGITVAPLLIYSYITILVGYLRGLFLVCGTKYVPITSSKLSNSVHPCQRGSAGDV